MQYPERQQQVKIQSHVFVFAQIIKYQDKSLLKINSYLHLKNTGNKL